jgi:hypothetical protein
MSISRTLATAMLPCRISELEGVTLYSDLFVVIPDAILETVEA